MQTDSPIGQRWAVMAEALDERQRRLLAGVEAKVLGRGGISAVALATGVSRTTIMAGISEIEAMNSTDLPADQPAAPKTTGTRQAGGGRKKIELKDATLLPDLLSLVDSRTRGESLVEYETIVNLIARTTTAKGLKVKCRLDRRKYPTGRKISDEEMTRVNVVRNTFHGEWNYVIKPNSVKLT